MKARAGQGRRWFAEVLSQGFFAAIAAERAALADEGSYCNLDRQVDEDTRHCHRWIHPILGWPNLNGTGNWFLSEGSVAQVASARAQIASASMLIAMTALRLLAALATMKCLSSLFGPERFGTLAQVMGVAAIFFMAAGGGSTNGLIKNVSESREAHDREEWLRASFAIHCIATPVLALAAILLWVFGADALFRDSRLAPVFLAIGAAQALVGAGHIILSYLSGIGRVGAFAAINIAGSVLSAGGVILLAFVSGFECAAYGLAVMPAIPGILATWLLIRRTRSHRPLLRRPNVEKIGTLLRFSGAMLLAVCAVPLAQLLIRADLAQHAGWHVVGQWQAVAKLSDAYMQVFGVLFINFLLPQLASRSGTADRIAVLKATASRLLGLYLLGAIALYVIRDPVIHIAYSAEFLPASSFVLPQLIADLARVSAYFFVYYFMAQGRLRLTTASEVYQGIAMYFFYVVLLPLFGEMAAVYNQVVTYIVLLAAMGAYFAYENRNMAGARCRT